MKIWLMSAVIGLIWSTSVYAVTVSVNSSIEIANAPVNSKWQVECGAVSGNYTLVRQFTMSSISNTVPVASIFPAGGDWFCRTAFVQVFGQGPYSNEIPVTVTVPVLSVPSLTVIP